MSDYEVNNIGFYSKEMYVVAGIYNYLIHKANYLNIYSDILNCGNPIFKKINKTKHEYYISM